MADRRPRGVARAIASWVAPARWPPSGSTRAAVLDEAVTEDNARAARLFNTKLAAHPRLESIIIPVNGKKIDGMSISIVKEQSA